MQFSLIYITAANEADAVNIGRTLVQEKLAACVNLHPIRSIYRWQDKIEDESEFAILAKTRASLVETAMSRVRELHSYSVPCILALDIAKGNADYLKWIEETTGGTH